MTARRARVVAVDLGASSGRVHVADLTPDTVSLRLVDRVPNGALRVAGRLQWDLLALYRGLLGGLAAARRDGPVDSVGIDSWAVDYGLVRPDGSLLGNPSHYRDPRTGPAYDDIVGRLGPAALWARTGVALQPFNTLYQLAADRRAGHLDGAGRVLLVPDLLTFWLTGEQRSEVTNVSTTQLAGPDGRWDPGLLAEAGVDAGHFAPPVTPGEAVGPLRPDVLADLGGGVGPVVHAVASHDTAAAVAVVPAADEAFAYISCGTWSLVGVELDAPVLSEEARQAGFTNERGVDATTRFLRNVMGLWLLQESVRTWEQESGGGVSLPALLADAARVPSLRSVFDVDRPDLLGPGAMPARVAAACADAGSPVPAGPAEITRAVLDSLAVAYRRALRRAEELTGRRVATVHVVGGGVHNSLLCQLTADACGRPVVAGPVEAAALGNALIQGQGLGVVPGDRWGLRRMVADHEQLTRYRPDEAATERYAEAARHLDRLGRAAAAAR